MPSPLAPKPRRTPHSSAGRRARARSPGTRARLPAVAHTPQPPWLAPHACACTQAAAPSCLSHAAAPADVAVVCLESVEDEAERRHLQQRLSKTHTLVDISRQQARAGAGPAQDGRPAGAREGARLLGAGACAAAGRAARCACCLAPPHAPRCASRLRCTVCAGPHVACSACSACTPDGGAVRQRAGAGGWAGPAGAGHVNARLQRFHRRPEEGPEVRRTAVWRGAGSRGAGVSLPCRAKSALGHVPAAPACRAHAVALARPARATHAPSLAGGTWRRCTTQTWTLWSTLAAAACAARWPRSSEAALGRPRPPRCSAQAAAAACEARPAILRAHDMPGLLCKQCSFGLPLPCSMQPCMKAEMPQLRGCGREGACPFDLGSVAGNTCACPCACCHAT